MLARVVSGRSLSRPRRGRLSLLRRHIQAEPSDCVRDPRGNPIGDRLAACDTSTDLRRGDRDGIHVELDDSIRCGESPSHRLDLRAVDTRPHGDGESHELENTLGRLPGLERCELVRAQHEVGIGRTTRFERVDRASVLVELDDSFGEILERQTCQLEPRLGRGRRVFVARLGDDEDEELAEPKRANRGPSRARRGRRAADRRPRRGSRSLPLELLLSDLHARAMLDPEATQSGLELVRRWRRADDAKAAVGAENAEARPASGRRRVVEELRQRLV